MPSPLRDLNVAVVGATGMVGQTCLRVLAERGLEAKRVKAVASERSAGSEVAFDGTRIPVHLLEEEVFAGIDLALFMASGDVARQFAPVASEAGALVVDNSSAWRMAENVPLVVPEVNAEDIRDNEGIVANPNCCTIPLTVVLSAVRARAGLERVLVATYQSASGAGKALVEELEEQTRAIAAGGTPTVSVYPRQLAHNVVPGGWPMEDEGYNEEEVKITNEARKILHAPDLPVTATCVRVPVPVGHGEAVFLETAEPVTPDELRSLLSASPGVVVRDDPRAQVYPTPAEVAGTDEVYVGRIRRDRSSPNGIALWVVSDNLRKGAALNAIQVAERAAEMGVL
jgi:aspartate-semialdehyde dehydrogenase